MTTPKTATLLAVLLLTGTGLLSAVDYGLELMNIGGVKKIADTAWYTDHKTTAWLTIPFDQTNTNSLAIEGSAYAAKPADGDIYKFFADLDLFRLSLAPVSSPGFKLSLDAGRISVVDITGLILNQTVDGAEFHGSFAFGNIDFLTSYTGLQNVRKTGALMTSDDYADSSTSKVYELGASRIIGKVTVQLPQIAGKMDLVTEAVAQYDMRRYLQSDYTEVVDTAYGTVQMSGPINNTLYISFSGTVQTGILDSDKKYSETSFLCSTRMDLFPSPKNQFYAQVLYTPGANSVLAAFLPITFQSAGTLYTDTYSNLIRGSAGWYFNPKPTVNFDVGGMAYFNAKEIIPGDGLYRGSEFSAGSTFQIASDLKFRLDGKIYLPKDEDMQYQLSLKTVFDL